MHWLITIKIFRKALLIKQTRKRVVLLHQQHLLLGTDLLPSVLKKLVELEEKVDMLQAKPSEMPYDKAELLNAAVCRVDALEAELIATKKV